MRDKVVIIMLFLILTAIALFTHCNDSSKSGFGDIDLVISYAEKNAPSFAEKDSKKRLILLLNFEDFSCPPCFDDLITFIDLLKTKPVNKNQIIALLPNKGEKDSLAIKRWDYWRRINDIDFPVLMMDNNITEIVNEMKSKAVVVDSKSKILFQEKFPMGAKKHNTIMQLMADKK